jgi:hypothetical protein
MRETMSCLGWEQTVEIDNHTTTSVVVNGDRERDPIRHMSPIPRRSDNRERSLQPTTPPIPDLLALNTLALSTASRIAKPIGLRTTSRVYINLHRPDVLPQAENRDWRLRPPHPAYAPPTPIVRSQTPHTELWTLTEVPARQQKGPKPRWR